jgi:hypothetical protein
MDDDLRERDALAERRIPETLPTTMDVFKNLLQDRVPGRLIDDLVKVVFDLDELSAPICP